MSKEVTKSNVPTVSRADAPSGVEGTPRKPRKKPIDYVHIIKSAYDPTKALTNHNPADRVVIPHRGAFQFAGLLIETNPLGTIVKIPESQTMLLNPTLRQVVEILDKIHAPKLP